MPTNSHISILKGIKYSATKGSDFKSSFLYKIFNFLIIYKDNLTKLKRFHRCFNLLIDFDIDS